MDPERPTSVDIEMRGLLKKKGVCSSEKRKEGGHSCSDRFAYCKGRDVELACVKKKGGSMGRRHLGRKSCGEKGRESAVHTETFRGKFSKSLGGERMEHTRHGPRAGKEVLLHTEKGKKTV